MRSAPLFQLVIVPLRSLLMMASSEDSTIAASISRVPTGSAKSAAGGGGSPPEGFAFGDSSRGGSSATKAEYARVLEGHKERRTSQRKARVFAAGGLQKGTPGDWGSCGGNTVGVQYPDPSASELVKLPRSRGQSPSIEGRELT